MDSRVFLAHNDVYCDEDDMQLPSFGNGTIRESITIDEAERRIEELRSTFDQERVKSQEYQFDHMDTERFR